MTTKLPKSPKPLTKQELFDTVSKHLLKQNAKSSIDNEGCKYRHGKLRCAIGCLIPNSVYSERMEGNTVVWLTQTYPYFRELFKETNALIRRLQRIHDWTDVDDWREGLRVLASKYKLNKRVLRDK